MEYYTNKINFVLGQYTRKGPVGALAKICPLLKGKILEDDTVIRAPQIIRILVLFEERKKILIEFSCTGTILQLCAYFRLCFLSRQINYLVNPPVQPQDRQCE